jgi:hypothetical protein
MLPSLKRALPYCLLATLTPGVPSATAIELVAKGAEPGSAVLELDTEVLVTMTKIPFRLVVKDAAGQPVSGAQVSCDLTMPDMIMPKNRPKVSPRDGFYGGDLIFTCAQGAWRISCEVLRQGHPRQTLIFDIDRVRLP